MIEIKGVENIVAKKVLLNNVDILKTHPPACCANFLSSKSRLGSLWVLCPNWNNDRYKINTRHSFHCHFLTWFVRGSWVWWVYPSVSISQFTCSTRYWINWQSKIIINCCGKGAKKSCNLYVSFTTQPHGNSWCNFIENVDSLREKAYIKGAVWSHIYHCTSSRLCFASSPLGNRGMWSSWPGRPPKTDS